MHYFRFHLASISYSCTYCFIPFLVFCFQFLVSLSPFLFNTDSFFSIFILPFFLHLSDSGYSAPASSSFILFYIFSFFSPFFIPYSLTAVYRILLFLFSGFPFLLFFLFLVFLFFFSHQPFTFFSFRLLSFPTSSFTLEFSLFLLFPSFSFFLCFSFSFSLLFLPSSFPPHPYSSLLSISISLSLSLVFFPSLSTYLPLSLPSLLSSYISRFPFPSTCFSFLSSRVFFPYTFS